MTEENKNVVIFSNDIKEYYIAEVLSVDNDVWKLRNVAQIFPISNDMFIPLGFAFPDRGELKIIPLSEFCEDTIFIKEPQMWTYANKRIARHYEDFVKGFTAKRSGIVLARNMEEVKKVGKQVLIK